MNDSTKKFKSFLENRFGLMVDLEDRAYQPIRNFAFIWNVFEREILPNEYYNEKDLWEYNAKPKPDQNHTDSFYNYLHDRYAPMGIINEQRFSKLRIIHKQVEDNLRNTLLSYAPTFEEKNGVCLVISYRYRNNFFHGNKEIINIWGQTELFDHVNNYLIAYLEANVKKTRTSLRGFSTQ